MKIDIKKLKQAVNDLFDEMDKSYTVESGVNIGRIDDVVYRLSASREDYDEWGDWEDAEIMDKYQVISE